jgi:hypothetical protein
VDRASDFAKIAKNKFEVFYAPVFTSLLVD